MTTSPDAGAFARLRAAVGARFAAIAAARLRLHENWRTLLRRAWSVRLALVAAVLSGIEVALSVFTSNPPIAAGTFAALSAVVTIAAAVARLFAQQGVTPECAS